MKRFVKSALFAALAPAFLTSAYAATSGNNAAVSPAERAKIEEVVHQYLISKPEVLLEAMQILQKKQFEQAQQDVQKTQQSAPKFAQPLFHTANDPIAGNANGKITVVEFFDYQCPHCVDMVGVIDDIVKANPNVRIVYKEWPIRGPMSEYASRAALAANKQGKYIEVQHALLTANKPLTQDLVLQLAQGAGANMDQLKKDMTDASIDNQLKETMKLAQDLKLFGTPAFFVGQTTGNNTPITYAPGQLTQQQLQDLVNKQ